MSMIYATIGELKTRIGITDTTDDTVLSAVLEAVSRQIDNYCNRAFGKTIAGTARYYTPLATDEVPIDDCVALTEVATDADGDRTYETTWAATDYDLLPENAGTSTPYTTLATSPRGTYRLPIIRKGLKLTGTWGWPEVPPPVHEACLIQASRIFKRKDTPFGISGSPEMGQMRIGRLDPDVKEFLDPYRHIPVT
jgi:hypothetical protein